MQRLRDSGTLRTLNRMSPSGSDTQDSRNYVEEESEKLREREGGGRECVFVMNLIDNGA